MGTIFKRITIIGVGLIGGSIAAALKAANSDIEIFGVDANEETLKSGLAQGLLHKVALPDDPESRVWTSAGGCDLVVLAVPVGESRFWLQRLADGAFDGMITDVASTKCIISKIAAEVLPDLARYIPGHPMAGSEMSGIAASSPTLFQGAYWILCPDENTRPEDYQALHELVVSLGARVISIDRGAHDNAIAIVSHVPHMVASSLVRLAANHATDQQNILRLAAGGFKDSTRIAAGSSKLWSGIALDNKEAIADGLVELKDIIADFENAIRNGDERELTDLLEYSARVRRDLPAKWVPDSSRLVQCRIPMSNRSGVIAEVTTIASQVGCNIQSIDIDHMTEDRAVLELILTDEGDIGRLSGNLIDAGFDVAFSPLSGRE